MENGKESSKSTERIILSAEQLEDSLEDIRHIIQLFELSLEGNQEDAHIIKSISIIHKMVNAVIEKEIVELKEAVWGEGKKLLDKA